MLLTFPHVLFAGGLLRNTGLNLAMTLKLWRDGHPGLLEKKLSIEFAFTGQVSRWKNGFAVA